LTNPAAAAGYVSVRDGGVWGEAAVTVSPDRVAAGTGAGTETVISVSGLRMRYGSFEAVRGTDLNVRRGEVFAFLGPYGAGKTTTVEILEGYRRRSAGEATVLGEDPAHAGPSWRARIGVVLQESEPERDLTAAECLQMYAGYYPAPRDVGETLELVGLSDKAGRSPAGCRVASGAGWMWNKTAFRGT
jgi:ABC-2 type transport system ATP-binding protein